MIGRPSKMIERGCRRNDPWELEGPGRKVVLCSVGREGFKDDRRILRGDWERVRKERLMGVAGQSNLIA